MKKINPLSTYGFTLVELLVTISIIVLLTGIIMTNITSSRSKSRDAKRISDVGQIQLALELYFDRCHQYPTPSSGGALVEISDTFLTKGEGCPAGVTFGSFISHVPTPPTGANQTAYAYQVNNNATPTNYVLQAILENYNEVVKDSLGTNPWPSPTIMPSPSVPVCDSASSSKYYCLSPN